MGVSKSARCSRGTVVMSSLDRITVNPEMYGGHLCIRGLRIRVRDVLEMLAGGATSEDILQDYPCLEAADIAAALEYAVRQSDHPVTRAA